LREAPGSSPGKILFFCHIDIVFGHFLVEEGLKMAFGRTRAREQFGWISRINPGKILLLSFFWLVEAQMKFWAGWGTLGRYENTER
jgi:hypothetical protein